ncbi:MAG: hypothetical protein KatS3mg113_1013 [Planctomycetaceae bacterium]|nr:MAG: hypothetical protein KatS3mg113_1013 [Planctomycetaceae bacterium]
MRRLDWLGTAFLLLVSVPHLLAQQPATSPAPSTIDPSLGPIIGSAPGYGEHKKAGKRDFKTYTGFRDHHFGFEGGYYAGPEGYYTEHHPKVYTYGSSTAFGCLYCQHGLACPPGGCPHCGYGCPQHHMTYQYKWPKNLVYPPNVMPAGMVQWPYYTLRGPTDFFYTGR